LKVVLIHSTIKLGSTTKIQNSRIISLICRVHRRFLDGIKKYTKFISSEYKQIEPKIKSYAKKDFKK